MNYDILLEENPNLQIDIFHFESNDLKGLYTDNSIAISDKIETENEKTCVLAEELGHYYTSTGNILKQNDFNNRKQEQNARAWAYEKLIPLNSLIEAFENGCETLFEYAEKIGVTESFLKSAMEYFKSKYGCCKKVGNYTLIFFPNYNIVKNN